MGKSIAIRNLAFDMAGGGSAVAAPTTKAISRRRAVRGRTIKSLKDIGRLIVHVCIQQL